MLDGPTKKMCPGPSGGNNFWPATYSQRTKLLYIPAATPCVDLTRRPELEQQGGRLEGRRLQADRAIRIQPDRRRPAHRRDQAEHRTCPTRTTAATLSTAGGLVFSGFTDGTFAAYDDTTLEQLWKINVGTGFNAPPMTFEVNGRQYIAILSGLSPIARSKHQLIPELKEQRNQTMLFVFSL